LKVSSGFKDMLRSLNAAGVRYLVVGGYAWMVHHEPRYTKDLDVWVEPLRNNADRAKCTAIGSPPQMTLLSTFPSHACYH